MAAGQDLSRWAAALALALTAALAGGCRDRDQPDRGDDADDGGDRAGRPPVLRADRLGGLNATSKVDPRALARAFPGLRITRSHRPRGFDIHRGREKLFTVIAADDGTVSSVEIQSAEVGTALGAKVGDPFDKLQRGAGPMDCNGGLDERAGQVLCTPRRARNVTFILVASDKSFAGDDIPPEKLPRLVGGRPISAILWRPPAPSSAAR